MAIVPDTGLVLCGLGNPLKRDEDPFVCWGDKGSCGIDPGLLITRPVDNDHPDVMFPDILSVLVGDCWDPIGTTLLRRTAFTPWAPAAARSHSDERVLSPSENLRNLLLVSCHTRAGTVVPQPGPLHPGPEPPEDTLSVSDILSHGIIQASKVATESWDNCLTWLVASPVVE